MRARRVIFVRSLRQPRRSALAQQTSNKPTTTTTTLAQQQPRNNKKINLRKDFFFSFFSRFLQFRATVKSQPHNSFVQRRPNSSSCVMCNWLQPSEISMFTKGAVQRKNLRVKSIRLETKQQQTQLIEQVATIVCPHCGEFRTRRNIARHQRCNKGSFACWQLKHNTLIVFALSISDTCGRAAIAAAALSCAASGRSKGYTSPRNNAPANLRTF